MARAKKFAGAKASTSARSRPVRKATAKRDRYGVAKTKKGSSKRRTGSRVMRGKSASDTMYVYNRETGSYTKKSKAQVKKLDVGTQKSGAKYKLITERTYNSAKKTKKKEPFVKYTPKEVRAKRSRKK